MAAPIREIGNSVLAEKSVERRAPEERGPSLLMLVVLRTHVLRVRLGYFRPHRNHSRLYALDDRGEARRSGSLGGLCRCFRRWRQGRGGRHEGGRPLPRGGPLCAKR